MIQLANQEARMKLLLEATEEFIKKTGVKNVLFVAQFDEPTTINTDGGTTSKPSTMYPYVVGLNVEDIESHVGLLNYIAQETQRKFPLVYRAHMLGMLGKNIMDLRSVYKPSES